MSGIWVREPGMPKNKLQRYEIKETGSQMMRARASDRIWKFQASPEFLSFIESKIPNAVHKWKQSVLSSGGREKVLGEEVHEAAETSGKDVMHWFTSQDWNPGLLPSRQTWYHYTTGEPTAIAPFFILVLRTVESKSVYCSAVLIKTIILIVRL